MSSHAFETTFGSNDCLLNSSCNDYIIYNSYFKFIDFGQFIFSRSDLINLLIYYYVPGLGFIKSMFKSLMYFKSVFWIKNGFGMLTYTCSL